MLGDDWGEKGLEVVNSRKFRRSLHTSDPTIACAGGGERSDSIMGNGVCSRRQRRIFQSLLLITVLFGMIYGGMISYEMHNQLKRTEAMAVKYQQHQESLSAQLQGKSFPEQRFEQGKERKARERVMFEWVTWILYFLWLPFHSSLAISDFTQINKCIRFWKCRNRSVYCNGGVGWTWV